MRPHFPPCLHASWTRQPVRAAAGALVATLLACGGGSDAPPSNLTPPVIVPVNGPAWAGFGRNAQHSAIGAIETQPLTRVVWQAPLDLAPQYQANGSLLIHYGSPLVTPHNPVLMPVKTGMSTVLCGVTSGEP